VAELQNLTVAGHPAKARHSTAKRHLTVAGRPIIAGHPSVAAQPPRVGQPTVAGHPTLIGHGMSTSWQNVQDRVPQQQPTLQSWEHTRRQEAWQT
jgi:hypothetical protein